MEDVQEVSTEEVREICVSCGAKRKGEFCRKCGERRIVPERDFSIRKFLDQTLWHFIHFDSKLLKTLRFLLFKPGFLTAEWTQGRRVAYMKPLQLFLVASVLFYFFLPTTTAHFTGPRDLIVGYREGIFGMNMFQYDFAAALQRKSLELGVDEKTLSTEILKAAASRSKTWLFLLIPLWGFFIYLFNRKKMPWLTPHFIFAMHALTFYILLDLSVHPVLYCLGIKEGGRYIFFFLMLVFPLYQAFAARRVYANSWPLTILKTAGSAMAFMVLIITYRQVVTISALASLDFQIPVVK